MIQTQLARRSCMSTDTLYMMLFLPCGFKLDPRSPAYKAEVQALGDEVERSLLAFAAARGSTAKSAGTVVTLMRALERSGDLKCLVEAHKNLRAEGDVVDPTPTSALPRYLR